MRILTENSHNGNGQCLARNLHIRSKRGMKLPQVVFHFVYVGNTECLSQKWLVRYVEPRHCLLNSHIENRPYVLISYAESEKSG
jgi:hypothetical protein